MKLTKEQEDIIQSTGDIKINAVAGSGKTTTIIEYAKARPSTSQILYLAFNKSVKMQAVKRFADAGLSNVQVETAHSLAYRHIVFRYGYKIRAQGYKISEIAELLTLESYEGNHTRYVIANHINKLIACFCNSNKSKVQEVDYISTITDEQARNFALSFYDTILLQARILLAKMDKGEIDITHDFYLKKFQLSNPQLYFDYILFDEGQDASPAMLDIFFKQNATKVIVGDTHQQIYGWRLAENSLDKANFKQYHLSTSFRFGQDIANLAMRVLDFKKYISLPPNVLIVGKGDSTEIQTKAIIARTNLGLLLKAIEYVTERPKIKKIYFEGDINSYTYADEGASLYDVLNLYNKNHGMIRDTLLKTMRSIDDLEDYIEKTDDAQLAMMVEIVKEYGNKIPQILKSIKEKHVENGEKDKADIIFSTVHRCKGMEYDVVQLINDFTTEKKLEILKEHQKPEDINVSKLNEEINLLYVALTRAKKSLRIPEALMPANFPTSPHIQALKTATKETKTPKETSKKPHNENAYMHQVKEKHKGAYQPWTATLDYQLRQMYLEGVNMRDLAKHFDRTIGAIAARVKKLELEERYE